MQRGAQEERGHQHHAQCCADAKRPRRGGAGRSAAQRSPATQSPRVLRQAGSAVSRRHVHRLKRRLRRRTSPCRGVEPHKWCGAAFARAEHRRLPVRPGARAQGQRLERDRSRRWSSVSAREAGGSRRYSQEKRDVTSAGRNRRYSVTCQRAPSAPVHECCMREQIQLLAAATARPSRSPSQVANEGPKTS
jgi:hypothetical protein